MNSKKQMSGLFALACLTLATGHAQPTAASSLSPAALTCEYLTNPLGIDVQTPRFAWQLADVKHTRGQKQTAYQILASGSSERLARGDGDLWDSGWVESPQSVLVPYEGKALGSGQTCYWKVRVKDKDGQTSVWSEPACFSMGLLNPDDWKGPWIKHPSAPVEKHLWFRKTFRLDQAPVRAVAYIASIGYHELYVNGQKADTCVLAPAQSCLSKRVLYVTYDITPFLSEGKNTVGVWTGPGWARYADFKTAPALRVQVNMVQTDGRERSWASDATWRCAVSCSENTGTYTFGDRGGEAIDARREEPGWATAGFDDSRWPNATQTPIDVTLSAQMIEPTRVIETLSAQHVSGRGPYVFDMGRNFTGWLDLRMDGQTAGDCVTLKVADDTGTVMDFKQQNIYICKGTPGERFKNRFNFQGGRYITVEGLRRAPQTTDLTGYALATDIKRTGHFSCSSPLFNTIYETDLWTYRANTVEGFTMDCPHRERLGYGEVAFATAWGIGLPNYRSEALYAQVVRDWTDVQEADGWIHHTAPQPGRDYGGPMWSSAGLNVAWALYQTTGDRRVLETIYPSARRWLAFLASKEKNGLLRNYGNHWGHFLGDWAAPGQRKERGDSPEAEYFNNCVYAMNLETAGSIASLLGKTEDAEQDKQRLTALRQMIHAHFFTAEKNIYCNGTQVQSAFALLTGVTPQALRPAVAAALENDLAYGHPYLDMGSSGLPILLRYFTEGGGRAECLAAPISSEAEPSYGYFLAQGETTWPEYWNITVPSRIHTCYTGIASWFIKSVGGIRPDPDKPGYAVFQIQPVLPRALTWAEADVESMYGPITSRWEKKADGILFEVTVPPNTEALLRLPTQKEDRITESGRPLTEAEGITIAGDSPSSPAMRLGSGRYLFFLFRHTPAPDNR